MDFAVLTSFAVILLECNFCPGLRKVRGGEDVEKEVRVGGLEGSAEFGRKIPLLATTRADDSLERPPEWAAEKEGL